MATTTQARAQWSYHVSEVSPSDMVEYEGKMAELGRQGWELVSAAALSLHGTFSTAYGLLGVGISAKEEGDRRSC